ncbi:ribonuclease H-like domain-containing protein [Tanacetum coccineum]
MEAGTTTTNLTARLSILNPGDYDLWLMRIEQYFLMTDYSLWEVVKNGNNVLKKTLSNVEQVYEPTTAEEKLERKNEMKARATLLMALPNKDQMKFHSYQDVKLLMEAIEKRHGGNKESKKVQRTLLKQQYENFATSSSETLDQTFDRLKKLITQLEIQGEVIRQKDMNLKLLRSLLTEWKTHALILRNKAEIETINLDDLYNNLKIYEPELTGSSSTSQNLQNMAFVSSNSTNSTNNTSSTNKTDNIACAVSTAHTQSNTANSTSADNLSDVVICAFLAKMDLQWEMAMLTIRARRFINRIGKKLDINGQRVGFDRKLETAKKERDRLKLTLDKFQTSSKSLNDLLESQVIDKFKTGLGYNAVSPAVESFVTSSEVLENDKSRTDKGYHAVPPPLTGTFTPAKPDLMFIDEHVESEFLDVVSNVTSSDVNTVESNHESAKNMCNTVESNAIRLNNASAPIIEDWNSDDESEEELNERVKTFTSSTDKTKFVKTAREKVEKLETPKQNKHNPRGNQKNWNNLMSQRLGSNFKMINKSCFICGSFEHLYYVCDKKIVRPVWNNSRRVNHKNFSNKITHPHPKRSFVPQAVLTRSGKINTAGASVNTARASVNAVTASVNTVGPSVNTAASTPIVNHPRPKSNTYNRGYSQISRPFNRYFANKNSINNKNVNTARVKDTTARERAGNPQQKGYKEKGVIDSCCSTYMTGNKCYLTEYEDFDGGFVSFGDGKGRITEKVLLRVPRKDNIYSVDLKSVVPTGGLTCLFAKDIIDESNKLMNPNYGIGGLNGVAKRRNKTLIEAVRTMLVDSKLPTTFWTEAVNTACYVLNRVLVIKPRNKTPYELIRGRPPLIDFMKPFGCFVTILNTRNHLGKFEGKADEGYCMVRFLENLPNVKGNRPNWLFDVDSLSISMNYVLVVAENKTNVIAGTKDNTVAGQAQKEKEPE